MRLWHRIVIGIVLIAAAFFLFKFLVGGSTVALFAAAGPVAAAERHLIVTMVLLMLAVVVPMFVVLVWFAWKYRAGNHGARYEPELRGRRNQLIMWAIPAALVAVLGVIAWGNAHALDPYQPIPSSDQPLVIQVVALPWKWLFVYPAQGIATVNTIEFPVGTPVRFKLTADGPSNLGDAPMSSFWIPQLGSQIYAMAAMETQLNLMASTTGEFTGKDTEINGEGYAGMTFTARAVTADDFSAWVVGVRKYAVPLDQAAYGALAAPSENNPPAYYTSDDPNFFNDIMMKYMMPAPASTTSRNAMSGMNGM